MFNENTGSTFIKYKELEKEGMQAIVLDLRDNPGGLLQESVKSLISSSPRALSYLL